MVAELKDYIKCYDGLFEHSFCQSTIDTFNNAEFSYTDIEQRPSFNELNVSQRYMAKDPTWSPVQKTLTNTFCDAVDLYMLSMHLKSIVLRCIRIMSTINLKIMLMYRTITQHVDF